MGSLAGRTSRSFRAARLAAAGAAARAAGRPDTEWWAAEALPIRLTREARCRGVARILGRARNVQSWGPEDGNRLDVWSADGRGQRRSPRRVDVRKLDARFGAMLQQFARTARRRAECAAMGSLVRARTSARSPPRFATRRPWRFGTTALPHFAIVPGFPRRTTSKASFRCTPSLLARFGAPSSGKSNRSRPSSPRGSAFVPSRWTRWPESQELARERGAQRAPCRGSPRDLAIRRGHPWFPARRAPALSARGAGTPWAKVVDLGARRDSMALPPGRPSWRKGALRHCRPCVTRGDGGIR
jgi:hypothetical protein